MNRIPVAALLGLAACTADFEDLNTNPNAPAEVPPALLLRQVTYDFAEELSFEGFTGGANLGQYFSAVPGFNAFDRGNLLAPQFGGNPWDAHYTNLRDVSLVLAASRATPSAAVYEGPARVLRSAIAGSLTDIFGAVPYAEAADGAAGVVLPAYTPQREIYVGPGGLLDELTVAVDVMDAADGAAALEGDILFGGDLEGWIRMANSLRLRYLLRASAQLDADSVAAAAQAIYDDARFVATGAQDAAFAFGEAPNDFRFVRARDGDFNNYLMSETVDSVLDALGDPRERLWFREAENGGFNGIGNGIPEGFPYDGGDVSFPGRVWREAASGALKANYVTAWETHLILAELAVRGYLDADARALYEEGVRLAFTYWNTDLPNDYLERDGVRFAGGDPEAAVEQIATQRWLAGIGQGYEGWAVWRRTGYPRFRAPLSSLNGGAIPIRFPYPADEQALNTANFEAAVDALGGRNSPNVPVWWDE